MIPMRPQVSRIRYETRHLHFGQSNQPSKARSDNFGVQHPERVVRSETHWQNQAMCCGPGMGVSWREGPGRATTHKMRPAGKKRETAALKRKACVRDASTTLSTPRPETLCVEQRSKVALGRERRAVD